MCEQGFETGVNQFVGYFMIREDRIAIRDLSLWDENARFPDKYYSKSEQELIKYFLEKPHFKIRELASKIARDYQYPLLDKLIVLDLNNKLIVLDGNRRLTVYKLLVEPALTQSQKLQDTFSILGSEINISGDFKLDCLVTDNKRQGFHYIDRRHLENNNEVGWGETERAHYQKRRGRAQKNELFRIEISKIVNKLEIPSDMKTQVLGPGFVSTFFRILDSKAAWKSFGFMIDDNGELHYSDSCFLETLEVIIVGVLKRKDQKGNKLDSRSLNKDIDKQKYLDSISKEDFQEVKKEIDQSKEKNLFGEEQTVLAKMAPKKSLPKSTVRSHLIPRQCVFQIHENKINNIYHELKEDLLIDGSPQSVPNAVGVLFRVFLEICIDHFLEREGLMTSKTDKIKMKIDRTVMIFRDRNIANEKQLKAIINVGTSTNSILSIDNFHEWVHSSRIQPTPSDLRTNWDNLQEFFEKLWEYLNKKRVAKQKYT